MRQYMFMFIVLTWYKNLKNIEIVLKLFWLDKIS